MGLEPATRLGIIAKPNEPRAAAVAVDIADWASKNDVGILVDDQIRGLPDSIPVATHLQIVSQSNLLIVLGGDGTMIGTAQLVGGRGVPVLGINLGWLGYLTDFAVQDAIPALENAVRGNYEVDRRTMLDWTVVRDGEPIGRGSVLNDVVVNKSALARVIEISCSIGEYPLTTYRGDGMIIATPTGSTAYNLSAGGPIIYPATEAICISPICPHTLTNRPIILPDTVEITLRLITREQDVMLTSDGQSGLPLLSGDQIKVKKSKATFDMVLPTDRDYFQILRDKLKWGGR